MNSRPAKRARKELSDKEQAVIDFLKSNSVDTSKLTFAHGQFGLAVHAAVPFSKDEVIALASHKLVLTAEKAWAEPLGARVKSLAVPCSDEMMLCLYVASRGEGGLWETWLLSFPATCPTPSAWPLEVAGRELAGTSLGKQVEAERAKLEREYAVLEAAAEGDSPPLPSLEEVRWAHSMYKSRSFPGRLASPASGSNVMMPLLDMFNHRLGEPIEWASTPAGVTYSLARDCPAGQELFANYGTKPNAELLFGYGFCLRPNPGDTVEVKLGGRSESKPLHEYKCKLLEEEGLPYTVDEEGKEGPSLSVGPFGLKRDDDGGMPEAIFTAMAICLIQQLGEEPQVTLDEVETLEALCTGKLASIPFSQEEDLSVIEKEAGSVEEEDCHGAQRFCATYRQGQREILRESIETLQQMLEGAEEMQEVD